MIVEDFWAPHWRTEDRGVKYRRWGLRWHGHEVSGFGVQCIDTPFDYLNAMLKILI